MTYAFKCQICGTIIKDKDINLVYTYCPTCKENQPVKRYIGKSVSPSTNINTKENEIIDQMVKMVDSSESYSKQLDIAKTNEKLIKTSKRLEQSEKPIKTSKRLKR